MSTRSGPWLAAAALGTAALVGAAALGIAVRGPAEGWPLLLVTWPVVGGLVVARRPRSLVGRLLILFGAGFGLATAVESQLVVTLEAGRPPPDALLWVSGWLLTPVFLVLVHLVAVFPTDGVTSRWMRSPLRIATGGTLLLVLARMLLPVEVASGSVPVLVNPWAVEGVAWLLPVEAPLAATLTVVLVVAVGDLALRWHRSAGTERLQMRWLALALLLFALLLVASLLLRLVLPAGTIIEVADTVAWLAGLSLLPVAIGVSVTRYRLFEIDRLLSRTVAHTTVVAASIAVYATGVLVLGALFPRQGDLSVAASTLAVAALFLPLRRRVQAGVDRRFNRSRYDAERELDRFASGLRDEVDLDGLTDGLLTTVASTVQPTSAGLWIRRRTGVSDAS